MSKEDFRFTGTKTAFRPETMVAFGMTPEDVRAASLATARDMGVKTYERLHKEKHVDGFGIGNDIIVELPVQAHTKEDVLMYMRTLITTPIPLLRENIASTLEQAEEFNGEMRTFVKGFGDAALKNDDYVTAVRAYDLASKDGIHTDPEALQKLREYGKTSSATMINTMLEVDKVRNIRLDTLVFPPQTEIPSVVFVDASEENDIAFSDVEEMVKIEALQKATE